MIKFKPETPVNKAAQKTISFCLDEVWSYNDRIFQPNNRDDLHRMRIAAKNLRYNMELFSPLYADAYRKHLKKIRKLQDYLGIIHDADVQIDILRKRIRADINWQHDQFKEIEKAIKKEKVKTEKVRDFHSMLVENEYSGLVGLLEHQIASRQKNHTLFMRYWKKMNIKKVYDSIRRITLAKEKIKGKGHKGDEHETR